MWTIRDAASRNDTAVNGQKIDEATVVDGNTIRTVATEFAFHESEEPPAAKCDNFFSTSYRRERAFA